jgi:hypothetical protein
MNDELRAHTRLAVRPVNGPHAKSTLPGPAPPPAGGTSSSSSSKAAVPRGRVYAPARGVIRHTRRIEIPHTALSPEPRDRPGTDLYLGTEARDCEAAGSGSGLTESLSKWLLLSQSQANPEPIPSLGISQIAFPRLGNVPEARSRGRARSRSGPEARGSAVYRYREGRGRSTNRGLSESIVLLANI